MVKFWIFWYEIKYLFYLLVPPAPPPQLQDARLQPAWLPSEFPRKRLNGVLVPPPVLQDVRLSSVLLFLLLPRHQQDCRMFYHGQLSPKVFTQSSQPASLFSLSSLFVGIINKVKLFCTDYLRLESIVISIFDFLNFFMLKILVHTVSRLTEFIVGKSIFLAEFILNFKKDLQEWFYCKPFVQEVLSIFIYCMSKKSCPKSLNLHIHNKHSYAQAFMVILFNWIFTAQYKN